jgi:hypothetical protein
MMPPLPKGPKKIEHVSASQLKTFRRCNRKWWWNKIAGIPIKETEAMVRGKVIHGMIEHYLLEGEWPDPDKPMHRLWLNMAKKGMEWLEDKQGTGNIETVEPYIEIQSDGMYLSSSQTKAVDDDRNEKAQAYYAEHAHNGWFGQESQQEYRLKIGLGTLPFAIKAVGYIDWRIPGENAVADHKTSGSDDYRPDDMALKADPQAILYCAADILHHPFENEEEFKRFRHYYYPTKNSASTAWNEVDLTIEEISDGLDKIAEDIDLMVTASNIEEAKDVSPNGQACKDFGKCPFVGLCNQVGDLKGRSNVDVFGAGGFHGIILSETKEEGKKMGFLDKIAKKEAAAGKNVGGVKPATSGINPPDAPSAPPPVVKAAPITGAATVAQRNGAVKALACLTPGELKAFKELPPAGQGWVLAQVTGGAKIGVAFNRAVANIAKKNPEEAKRLQAVATSKVFDKDGNMVTKGGTKSKPKDDSKLDAAQLAELQALTGSKPTAKPKAKPVAKVTEKNIELRNEQDPTTSMTAGQIFAAYDAMGGTGQQGAGQPAQGKAQIISGNNGPTLYVDCAPSRHTVTYFHEWVMQFVGVVLREHNAVHYSLPPLDYGKGRAYVGVEISRWLAAGNKLPTMYVSSDHALYNNLIEATGGQWWEIVK